MSTSIGEGLFWLALVLLALATSGDPDLIDAMVHRLMECG